MAQRKAFRVEGSFKMGSRMSHFAIETIADDAAGARERVVSTLGSKHRVDRHHLKIDGVKEIAATEITDDAVEYELKKGA